jgi:hypothetical protein
MSEFELAVQREHHKTSLITATDQQKKLRPAAESHAPSGPGWQAACD